MKNKLIEKYRSYDNFIGLIHVTELENFLLILKDGKIYSRAKKRFEIDSASQRQIRLTSSISNYLIDYARFYLAPLTPTYYQMNLKNPVMLVFDEECLLKKYLNIRYIDRQINSRNVITADNVNIALNYFDYDKIFDRTPKPNRRGLKKAKLKERLIMGEGDSENFIYKVEIDEEVEILWNPSKLDLDIDIGEDIYYFISRNGKYICAENEDYIQYRNAEVAIENFLSLKFLKAIYFRKKETLEMVIEELDKLQITKKYGDIEIDVKPELFHPYREEEEYNYNDCDNDDDVPF